MRSAVPTVKGSRELGIVLPPTTTLQVMAYSDASETVYEDHKDILVASGHY